MSFRFAWFVLFISTCSAQNDGLEGSGEGSGEGDLLTSENVWQSLSVQQDGDVNDVREFAGTCMDNIFNCLKIKFVEVAFTVYPMP